MRKVKIYNPTNKDLVFPLNEIKLPSKKTVEVEEHQAKHILKTWQFLETKGVAYEVKGNIVTIKKETKEEKKVEKKKAKQEKKEKKTVEKEKKKKSKSEKKRIKIQKESSK